MSLNNAPISPNECLKEAYRRGKYSDLTIRCGDKSFAVHKVVLCTQSEYFENAMKPEYQEGQSGVITIEDECPFDIQQLIQYLYTGSYGFKDRSPDYKYFEILLDARMIVLGDKYLVLSLKNLATSELESTIEKDFCRTRFSSTLTIADFNYAVNFIYRNLACQTGREARKVLVNATKKHYDDLRSANEWKELLKTIPDYAEEVARVFNTSITHSTMKAPEETIPLLLDNRKLQEEKEKLEAEMRPPKKKKTRSREPRWSLYGRTFAG